MTHLTYGTIKSFRPFDAQADAEVLQKAMKGLGTDESAITEVLAHRANSQRQEIAVAYKTLYGSDLIDDLKGELSGHYEDVINALMTPLPEYCAKELHHAMHGAGTNEDALIEILCTRSNDDINAIKEAYQTMYEKALEDDLKGDTSGCFRRLMISMCTGARPTDIDYDQARQDAQNLYEAGEAQWGTEESAFNVVMAGRSYEHLRAVFREYQKLTGHTAMEAVESEMSGDVKEGMLAVVKSVINRPAYFAERLHDAISGAGTDDRSLIRLVATRCEVDLVQVKEEYERIYEKSLEDAVSGDTSGDYKRILLALVVGN